VFILVFEIILKFKCGTHYMGLDPDTCILGSHMLVKVVMTVS
jgi:hypothetical protein